MAIHFNTLKKLTEDKINDLLSVFMYPIVMMKHYYNGKISFN